MARQVAVSWLGGLKADSRVGGHRVLADEPVDKGGDDAGPAPTELLLAALGA